MSTQTVEIIPPNPSTPECKPLSIEDRIALDIGPDHAPIAVSICDEIAVTPKAVKTIAAEIMGKTEDAAERQFHRWRVRSTALCQLYARARESRADVIADEIIQIVDTEPDPHKARARMDARKWYAGKLNRGMYGDDPVVAGPVVNVNVDHGSEALALLEQRLSKRAKQLSRDGGGMLGGEEKGGDAENPPLTLPSRT